MIARFGGEEFVMLCYDCDLASGIRIADDIRLELERTPIAALKGKCMSASFVCRTLDQSMIVRNRWSVQTSACSKRNRMGVTVSSRCRSPNRSRQEATWIKVVSRSRALTEGNRHRLGLDGSTPTGQPNGFG